MAITILDIYPNAGASNVPIDSNPYILLDTPVDLNYVIGSIFIAGSDAKTVGGQFTPLSVPKANPITTIKNPGYNSIHEVTYKSFYVDTNGSDLGTAFKDYEGTASYRSKIVLYPTVPFDTLHKYSLYVNGTSTSNTSFGFRNRTVFDPLAETSNSGGGVINSKGGYLGTADGTYTIMITSDGPSGSSKYKYKFNSDPYSSERFTHYHYRKIGDSVKINFDSTGTFISGDEYTLLVKQATSYIDGINKYSFTSASYGVTEVTNTSGLMSQIATSFSFTSGTDLSLVRTNPINLMCDIPGTSTTFEFIFSKRLGAATLDPSGILIQISDPLGDTSVRSSTSYFPDATEVSVSGSSLSVTVRT